MLEKTKIFRVSKRTVIFTVVCIICVC